MANIIIRRPDRELLSPELVPPHLRRGVSGTVRGYEEADTIMRRYDRRSEGGQALKPLMITDERENDRVAIEGHNRARDGLGRPVDGEQIVMGSKHKKRTCFI